MPSGAAPSAKILIGSFSRMTVLISSTSGVCRAQAALNGRQVRCPQDHLDRLTKRLDAPVRRQLELLGVMPIDKNSPAASAMTAIDILPAIANQKTLTQIDLERFRGTQDHSRLRLAAVARIRPLVARVPADLNTRYLGKGFQ